VRDNIYVLRGPGGNVTVQLGNDGVLLVDTMTAAAAEQVLAKVRTLSRLPIRYIINTHYHPDHTGGNAVLAKAGIGLSRGGGQTGFGRTAEPNPADIIAHETVLGILTAQEPELPFEALPTKTYFQEQKALFFNNEPIQVIHQAKAHTDGDSIVFFRKSDVIALGDLYTPVRYPYIDAKRGGSLQGVIDALNRVLDLTVSDKMGEGGTIVIPGHGRVGDEADLVEYRDMLTIVRNYIREMIREGKSLEQVQAAKPTFGYDPIYGSESGFWTTKQFVEAAYRELRASR
jgi:glyoxylase-like metal-dependent hydrolase (beta-lactamase superfamily II)